jgi:hypothetical protein
MNTYNIISTQLIYDRDIIQPFDYGVMDISKYSNKIEINDYESQVIINIKSNSAYTDTDSCFQQCKILSIINGDKFDLDYTKPNTSKIMKIMFNYGTNMFNIMNADFLMGLYRLKFEKMLSYLSIIKKRYSSYTFTTLESIDNVWKMSQSGGSLVQRSTNAFHKSTILYLEKFIRKLIMNSVSQYDISTLLKDEINKIKEKALNDLKTGNLTYKDFMRTRGFRKTKNENYKAYQMVLIHNEEVKNGLSKSKIPYINQGERYYTILLIDIDKEPSNCISDHEYIISGKDDDVIPNKKIYFDHYWTLIENDIEKRYSMWKNGR